MIFSVVLIVVGAALAVIGFNCMKPRKGDVPIEGGGFVNVPPQERPQTVRDAGKMMLGIGLIMIVGGVVWILTRILMALAGIVLVVGVIVAAIYFVGRKR